MQHTTFQDLFLKSVNTFGTSLSTSDIIISLLLSFATGLFIFYIYKKTYSGVLYSKNFNVALIIATMVASLVIMAIGGNLALSLGMVGALSIIRFRTPIKDPKDIVYLFWAVAAGIVNGVHFYKLSVISSAMIGTVLFIFSKKMVTSNSYVVILKHSDVDQSKIISAFKKYCSKFETRNSVIDDSNVYEKTIETHIKEENVDRLLVELKEIKGVSKVMIFSHSGELSE